MSIERDDRKWAVTYGISYPSSGYVIHGKMRKEDFDDHIVEKQVLVEIDGKTILGKHFHGCTFYINYFKDPAKPNGATQKSLNNITFKRCGFVKSFMGKITYQGCRFVEVHFSDCDFENAKFVSCVFDDCSFSRCTAWNASFESTSIDSFKFLNSIFVPIDNFRGSPPEIVKKAVDKHEKTMFDLSQQLVISLAEGAETDYYDSALYYAKFYRVKLLKQRVANAKYYEENFISVGQRRQAKYQDKFILYRKLLNLLLTKGGTSVGRLLYICWLAVSTVIPAILYWGVNLVYHGSSEPMANMNYFRIVAASVELFLAFGFTNFEATSTKDHVILVSIAGFGLLWYGLLIPVFFRRIYK